MANISHAEVKRIAALAKIQLSDEAAGQMALELGRIVEFVEQLQSVDITKVDPTSQVTGLVDVWRADQIRDGGVPPDQLLQNAPEREGGYIKVRRVLQ